MPVWAKVLITLVVLFLIGPVLGAIMLYAALQFANQPSNPEADRKLATDMVTLPSQLPQGWNYDGSRNIEGVKQFNLKNKSTNTIITFMDLSNGEKRTAKELVESTAKECKFEGESVEGEGTAVLGGREFAWVRVHCPSKFSWINFRMNPPFAEESAYSVWPPGKAMLIDIVERQQERFLPELSDPLMTKISGFPYTTGKVSR